MRDFKFFNSVLLKGHDGHDICVGERFYTVNKEDMVSLRNNRTIPKYTIVERIILKEFERKFKPDHEALWYFKSKQNAEWLIRIWKRQDEFSI
jgi:hypothetical protein